MSRYYLAHASDRGLLNDSSDERGSQSSDEGSRGGVGRRRRLTTGPSSATNNPSPSASPNRKSPPVRCYSPKSSSASLSAQRASTTSPSCSPVKPAVASSSTPNTPAKNPYVTLSPLKVRTHWTILRGIFKISIASNKYTS